MADPGHPHKHTGLDNEGFFGIGVKAGEEYRFSVWARLPQGGTSEKIRIELVDTKSMGEHHAFATETLTVDSKEWKKYQVILKPGVTDPKATLRIFLASKGTVDLEHVSLFPVDTWKGHENGLRKDLAQALADIKPGVFRFPGGCIVEGTDLATRYDWKKSVGPVENRPLNENRWEYTFPHRFYPDYFQSYGLGFFEFFQLSEEIGAEPLPVLSCGLSCQFQNSDAEAHVAVCDLDSYVQDALDLIEFANGDVTTKWGKLRADMGHPAPFNLKFIGIGNEQWGPEYPEHLEPFIKAIRKAYPDIKIIGSSGPDSEGKQFEYLWPEMKRLKVDLVDEHFYRPENWFLNQGTRYDNYDRKGPKVFAGEYACHGKGKKWNHFNAALLEAAFMTGLERNADIVHMATYAPLFAHVEGWQWRPDMIWFDNHQVYGSVNYYVQSMFMRHQGTHRLDFTVTEPELEQTARLLAEQKIRESAKTISGPIRVLVNEGQGVFFEVTVKNHDTGKLHRFTDCVCGTESENRAASYENAVETGVIPKDWTNYTLTMKAKETEGKKGFLVYLGEASDHMLWTLGGWQNLDISMEHFKNGRGACLSEAMFSAEKDHEYELMLVVKDRTMKIYVDGEEYLDTIDKIPVPKPLYVSAALDEATGDVIVKAVNITGNSQTAQLALDGVNGTHNVLVEKMAAALSDENTMENKKCVVPAVSEETIPDGTFTRTFEPYSLTILRIRQ